MDSSDSLAQTIERILEKWLPSHSLRREGDFANDGSVYRLESPDWGDKLVIVSLRPLTGGHIPLLLAELRRYGDRLGIGWQRGAWWCVCPAWIRPQFRSRLEAHGVRVGDARLLREKSAEYGLVADLARGLDERNADHVGELRDRLLNLPTGRSEFREFEELVRDLLVRFFVPPLGPPSMRVRSESGLHERDIVFPNRAETGFWGAVSREHSARLITVDAKNYGDLLPSEEVWRFSKYLARHRGGRFGILATRNGLAPSAVKLQREIWRDEERMIIDLNETDFLALFDTLGQGQDLESLLNEKLEGVMAKA